MNTKLDSLLTFAWHTAIIIYSTYKRKFNKDRLRPLYAMTTILLLPGKFMSFETPAVN